MTSEQKLIRRMKNRKARIIVFAIALVIQIPIIVYAGIKFQQGMDLIDQQIANPQGPTLNTAQMAKLTLAMADLNTKGYVYAGMLGVFMGALVLAIFDNRNRIIIANYEKIAELEQRLDALNTVISSHSTQPQVPNS